MKSEKEVKVYHVSTGADNPVQVGEIVHLVYDYFKKTPMRDRQGQPIQIKPWKFPSLAKFQRKLKYRYQVPLKTLIWLMDRAPFGNLSRQKRRMSLLDATLDNAMALSQIYSTYVQLDCLGGAPVSAYLSKPKGAKPRSLPALLRVHGAGTASSSQIELFTQKSRLVICFMLFLPNPAKPEVISNQ